MKRRQRDPWECQTRIDGVLHRLITKPSFYESTCRRSIRSAVLRTEVYGYRSLSLEEKEKITREHIRHLLETFRGETCEPRVEMRCFRRFRTIPNGPQWTMEFHVFRHQDCEREKELEDWLDERDLAVATHHYAERLQRPMPPQGFVFFSELPAECIDPQLTEWFPLKEAGPFRNSLRFHGAIDCEVNVQKWMREGLLVEHFTRWMCREWTRIARKHPKGARSLRLRWLNALLHELKEPVCMQICKETIMNIIPYERDPFRLTPWIHLP